jgi:transcriptional regulator with XRE-family HTH domain
MKRDPGGIMNDWLAQQMAQRGISKSELARCVGVSHTRIQALLGYGGKPPQPPSLALRWRLVGFFDPDVSSEAIHANETFLRSRFEYLIDELGPDRLLFLASLGGAELRELVDQAELRAGRRSRARGD